MEVTHQDRGMRLIALFVRGMYIFGIAHMIYGFWSAREAFYSPPLGVLIAAYVGSLSVVAMMAIFGILIFAKRPEMMLAKIFFLRTHARGGDEQ